MQESRKSFYLSAPKVTDLLALMLVDTPADLQLQYLQGALTPAFRAAALSASLSSSTMLRKSYLILIRKKLKFWSLAYKF